MTAPARAKRRSRPITVPPSSETRILVAAAGDRESLGALQLAAALAQRDRARVMLLGVTTPFPQNLSTVVSIREPVAIDEAGRRALLEELRTSVRQLPDAARWAKRVVIGFPADSIAEEASRWDASLIVLGIGRHGRLKRLLGRETAVAVMRRAHVPVLAAHPSATSLPRHAIAAVDFTRASNAAAELASRLLAIGGTLTVAHVCAFGDATARDGDLIDLYRTGAQAKMDELVDGLRRSTQRPVRSEMLSGEPAEALLTHAKRSRADLIAMGGHELGLMDRILLGSVRTQIVRGARCSVLIAPPEGNGGRRRSH
jgi:nucleotide-binding universal stress UspA family protein